MGTLKSHYSVLNIPEGSSEEEIKRAYRKLVMRYHPDKNSDRDSNTFREIQESYDALISQHPRKAPPTTRKPPARPRKGTDITLSLKISATDIAGETLKNIQTTRFVHCPDCNGTGGSCKVLPICSECNGSGIDRVSAIMGPKKFCNFCKGYGDCQGTVDCKRCKGVGLVKETIVRQVRISRDFQPQIVIPQSGNYPLGNGTPGNLIINLIVEKSCNFEVEGKNIKGPLKISPAQAVLGDIIFIDVFGDPVKVNIHPGTKHGETIEKENAGITKGNKKGSLFLKIAIDIPKKISDEERSLYTQLLKLQKGYL